MKPDRVIWAAARAAYLEMGNIMHDHDASWAAEIKLRGDVWFGVAMAALQAAEECEKEREHIGKHGGAG